MPKWTPYKYHVGLLMRDRQRDPAVDRLADFWFARRDQYLLVQRRVADNVYEYFAVPRSDAKKRGRPRTRAA